MLEEQGVTSRSPLETGRFQSQCESIIYLSFPDVRNMKIIANQVLQQSEFSHFPLPFITCFTGTQPCLSHH